VTTGAGVDPAGDSEAPELLLSWLHEDQPHEVRVLRRVVHEGEEFVEGVLTKAPRFPLYFRREEEQLLRLSSEEAEEARVLFEAAHLRSLLVVGAGGRQLLPITEITLAEQRYATLVDMERGELVVGVIAGDSIDPVEDPEVVKAVRAALGLLSLPPELIELSQRHRDEQALAKARAHLLQLSHAMTALGGAGLRQSQEYREASAAYAELSRLVADLEAAGS
jgi:hypothetical protein